LWALFWGHFKEKIAKILHISNFLKKPLVLGEFSLAIFENIRQFQYHKIGQRKEIPWFWVHL
jgi:hypothetical protein